MRLQFSGEGTSNCFVAKLPSGGLLVISPPSTPTSEQLAELEAYGEVEALVANNGFHYLGLSRWRELFPRARLFAAAGAAARTRRRGSGPCSPTCGSTRPR